MPSLELVMYGRTLLCPNQRLAERVLKERGVPYRSVMIDKLPEARERVLAWTGFLSVPTLVLAHPGQDLPHHPPAPLDAPSPRGIDRGSMLTEPNERELIAWLERHGLL